MILSSAIKMLLKEEVLAEADSLEEEEVALNLETTDRSQTKALNSKDSKAELNEEERATSKG